MKVTRWKMEPQFKKLPRHTPAESRYDKDADLGTIWFYGKYFEEKEWKKRMTTFLHELIHVYLFRSEPECYEWFGFSIQSKKERIRRETTEEQYHIDLANWIIPVLYPRMLLLPLELLAEEFFKHKYPDLFKGRTDRFYDLKVAWEPSFEKLSKRYKNKGLGPIAPYIVYIEVLEIGHFLNLVDSEDHENLARFQRLLEKRRRLLKSLSSSEQMEYFDRNEEKLIGVSLEPLCFLKEAILDLARQI